MTNLLDFPVEVRLTGDFCSIFISYRLKSFIHNQKNDDEYIELSVHLHEFILIVNFIAYGRQPYEIGMGIDAQAASIFSLRFHLKTITLYRKCAVSCNQSNRLSMDATLLSVREYHHCSVFMQLSLYFIFSYFFS